MNNEQKCYVFECNISSKAKIYVYAKDEETARLNCNLCDCDDIEYDDETIEEITGVYVEDEK